jgi:predicted DNA-binding WGR domain protein
MPRFVRDDEFWEIEREGRVVRVRMGRVGEPGEERVHTAAFEHEAMCDFDERIEAKEEEGYRPVEQPREQLLETDPVLGAAVLEALAPERLETAEGVAALRAAWSVLGDWFSSLGDVRGELISLDETLADVEGMAVRRLLARRDSLLATWITRWFGDYGRLDGVDRPIHLAWDHGFVTAARIGTEPCALDLSRWRLALRDLVPVLDTLLSHPLMIAVQQLRIAELDPHSRRDLSRALPLLPLASRKALLRLELGGVSRGDWVRSATGSMTQRETLARIGSLAPLALASRWAPRLAALRVIGRELRVFPPLPQLRVLELQVPVFDEELRGWLIGGPWPRLERLWLRSTNLNDPWADGGGEQLDELLATLQASPLCELGLQGQTALDRLVWLALSAPLRLDELRLFGLGDGSVDPLLDAHDYLGGVDRIVLEDTQITKRWPELQSRYGDRLHRCNETFGVVGEHTGNMLTESLFDAPGWKP